MEDSKEAALLGEAWVHSMDYDKLCARVAFFASALTPRVARRAFQLYPAIGMIDAEASLGTKLEALESSLGCDPLALVARSPQVLSLSAAHISERVEALRSISSDFDAVIVAFPQVLNHNPDSLLHKIEELDAALPDYVDAVDLIKVNPKLLGYNVSNTLLPKLKRLRELCSEAEWQRLTEGSLYTLGSALCRSSEVIERLSMQLPETAIREKGRPIPFMLCMSKRDFPLWVKSKNARKR
ncbi:MAG: hypothetical protein SGPRY_006450 [Prymnesium sp.]